MKKYLIVLIVLLSFVSAVFAQPERIRIANYNVLNFPGNNGNDRVGYFEQVVNSMSPDILVCQEMQTTEGCDLFLDEVLGEGYARAPFVNGPDTDNIIFFNSNLFEYVDQHIVETTLRDINVYRLNYLLDDQGPDLYIASAHLKASQGEDNVARRLGEVEDFLEYYTANLLGENVTFCGDLNLYTSTEAAYQALLGDDNFYDPINRPGNWHNSAQFADIHTQSPRTEQFGGGATGGMDDRFDFILASPAFDDDQEWGIDTETYTAYGNDGDHFDQAINDGVNQAVGEEIADALHEASDHLPVYVDLLYYNNNNAGFTGIIPLQENYFELISFPVVPEDLEVTEVFAEVNDLRVIYQNNGDIYIPPFVNSIGNIDISQGYAVYCSQDNILQIEGDPVDPNTIYSAFANRWNWIGYPYELPMPVEDALAEIEDEIVIILNDDGDLWIPEMGLNTLQTITPGEGYMLLPSTDLEFRYIEAPGMMAVLNDDPKDRLSSPLNAPRPTGKPYPILVDFENRDIADQVSIIEVYDNNTLVGSAFIEEDWDFTPVIAWEGDIEQNLKGFNKGNEISVVARNSHNEDLKLLQSERIQKFGEDAYAMITLGDAAENMNLPVSLVINDLYPNPFNSTATVKMQLPYSGRLDIALYNVEGRVVKQLVNGWYNQGEQQFSIEADNLASGIYFLTVLTSQGDKQMKKLVLIR